MTTRIDETTFMQNLIPQLRAEGYEVYLQPTAPVVPDFLASLRPDAIAIGKGKKIIIELVTSEGAQENKTKALASLVKQHPEWELRVMVIESASRTDELRVQSLDEIQSALTEVRALETAGHTAAALLLAWGAFEAISRRILSSTFAKPQTPGRLVQYIAQEGYISPSEADRLRVLATKRNAFIHGNFDIRTEKADVTAFRQILERLAAEPVSA
jgi:uncharacterized protein YutE (UPF0331/DUF86 family)